MEINKEKKETKSKTISTSTLRKKNENENKIEQLFLNKEYFIPLFAHGYLSQV